MLARTLRWIWNTCLTWCLRLHLRLRVRWPTQGWGMGGEEEVDGANHDSYEHEGERYSHYAPASSGYSWNGNH